MLVELCMVTASQKVQQLITIETETFSILFHFAIIIWSQSESQHVEKVFLKVSSHALGLHLGLNQE
jgi:hypothetical protein